MRQLLRQHLLLVLGAGALAGCDTNHEECLYVEEDAECPDVDTLHGFNDGVECGGGTTVIYKDFSHREETLWWDTMDSGDAENGDLCCYTTVWRQTVRGQGCIVGRPLTQEGSALTAAPTRRRWAPPAAVAVAGLSAEERRLAGAHWLRQATEEHASIASFARFSAQLRHHGAPPELLARARRAAADEVAHARDAFAIASALLGEDLAPGRLPALPPPSTDLVQLAVDTAREGAIGEILAVLVAAEQLRRAEDPAIRAALQRVIADETEHAELAWATLRWALAVGGAPVREALEGVFAALRTPEIPGASSLGPVGLGLVPPPELERALRVGLERVVRPAADLLLATG